MLGVPGFLLRTLSNPAGLLAGNVGVGGAHGTTGQERLPFPSEMAEETPPIRQISSAPFPEPREVPKVEKPLGIDQSTQTQEDQDRWNLWLHRCLIGKGLTEYGVTQADLTLAKDLVMKMDLPSQRRDKRWKQRQQQAVSFALFANGRTVPVVVHPLSHGVCWIGWRNVFEAARASARSLPIGSEEGMGSDRMLGLCSYGCFAGEGERTASAPEGAVVNQGRQCEKRSPTEIAVVLCIIDFLWRGECVCIRTRRMRSFWKAINHACLWWENLADGRAAPRLCA